MRYDFGIRSCATQRPFRADDLGLIHDHGFTAVELSFNRGASQINWSDMALGRSVQAAASHLSIRLSGHVPDELGLALPDPDLCAQNTRQLARMIEAASVFGIENLVCHPDGLFKSESSDSRQQMENLIRALEALFPFCERTGIRILLETMPPPRFASRLANLLTVLDRVQSKYVAICVDTNHLNLADNLGSAIRKLDGRMGEVHLNDNHGYKEEHLLPFDGIIRWDEVAEAVAAIDFTGSIILEPSRFDQSRHADLVAAAGAVLPKLRETFAAH